MRSFGCFGARRVVFPQVLRGRREARRRAPSRGEDDGAGWRNDTASEGRKPTQGRILSGLSYLGPNNYDLISWRSTSANAQPLLPGRSAQRPKDRWPRNHLPVPAGNADRASGRSHDPDRDVQRTRQVPHKAATTLQASTSDSSFSSVPLPYLQIELLRGVFNVVVPRKGRLPTSTTLLGLFRKLLSR